MTLREAVSRIANEAQVETLVRALEQSGASYVYDYHIVNGAVMVRESWNSVAYMSEGMLVVLEFWGIQDLMINAEGKE